MSPQPYGSAARAYFAAGYWPLPLPPRKKASPPEGYTGRNGRRVDPADVDRWITGNRSGNIGLRLPAGVAGIDVDAYKDDRHKAAWEELTARCGPLPDAPWCSSRNDGISGIRLFRVPEDWEAAGKLPEGGNGVSPGEVIQSHHRYVVCPPSIHPGTGRAYRWRSGSITKVADLPALPKPWLDALSSATVPAQPAARPTSAPRVADQAGGRPGGDFNERADWFADILGPHGWELHHETGGTLYVTRPGKLPREGHSATIGHSKDGVDRLYVFSAAAAPFEMETPYTKFAAYALLNHGADYQAAARELGRIGYGRQQPTLVSPHAVAAGGRTHGDPDVPWPDGPREVRRVANETVAPDPGPPEQLLEPAECGTSTGSADAGAHLPSIPEYPVDGLTGPLREIVDAGLAAGLPAALVGGAALGALATVCGQADLAIYETWTVRPCLWVALIAPPGGGKTPAITMARRMLRELDANMHASYSDQLQTWLATPAKDRGEPPADPTRLINDITIEMVARWLAAGDGTGGVDADELTEWLRSLSKYRQGGGTDAARWLGLWSTQPWRYQRVGAHIDLLVPRPVITVCGGIQPQFLPLLGREGDGMRPRWLPHMSLTTDLDPKAGRPAPAWDAAITKLYESTHGRTWTMPRCSLELWRDAQKRWKLAQRGLESPSVTAALAKADEQAARIALVIAESLNPAAGGEVPAEAVTAAIAIIDYTLAVWRALPGGEILALSRRDAELGEAVDKLAEWLERHGGSASAGDLRRACVAGIRTAAKLAEVLAEYEATYPGSVREERKGNRGPAGTYVYAPRREHTKSSPARSHIQGESVGANSSPNRRMKHDADNRAGHSTASSSGETVDTADSFSANSKAPTVPATESSSGKSSSDIPEDEFWAHDSAPEPAAEPSALALIHDVLGGEVITTEGSRRPIRWRDDGIPAIGDGPACGPAA